MFVLELIMLIISLSTASGDSDNVCLSPYLIPPVRHGKSVGIDNVSTQGNGNPLSGNQVNVGDLSPTVNM